MSKIRIADLCYCDTDCIVFRTGENRIDLETGVALGDLGCEIYGNHGLIDSIGVWVALAPKTYAYKLKENSNICAVKCKGITLNFTTTQVVNIESMINMLRFNTDRCVSVSISHQMERLKAKKVIKAKTLEKEFSFTFDKRVVLDVVSYTTLPYGHCNILDKDEAEEDKETKEWKQKVQDNYKRREVKKAINRYQSQQVSKEQI